MVEVFDRRIDWLIAALPIGIAVFLFYGAWAGLTAFLLVMALTFLKPLCTVLETPRSRIAVAAGVVLLLSPLFRLVFTDGFCFGARFSPFGGFGEVPIDSLSTGVIVGELARQAGTFCEGNLWGMLESSGGTGYIRDIGFTVSGAALLVLGLMWGEQSAEM